MMDLDEAIQHCEEVAMNLKEKGFEANVEANNVTEFGEKCYKCASEHRQLAEWLKELKAYRSRSEIPNTCGDAISRQAVMDCLKKWQPYMATRLFDFEKELSALPFITPQQRTGCWIGAEVLDKIKAEIERQEKWLLQAGYNAHNVDIAFDAVKHLLAESEE